MTEKETINYLAELLSENKKVKAKLASWPSWLGARLCSSRSRVQLLTTINPLNLKHILSELLAFPEGKKRGAFPEGKKKGKRSKPQS